MAVALPPQKKSNSWSWSKKKKSRYVSKEVRAKYYQWRYDNKCPSCDSSGFGEEEICPACRGTGLAYGTMVPHDFVDAMLEEFLDIVIDPNP